MNSTANCLFEKSSYVATDFYTVNKALCVCVVEKI